MKKIKILIINLLLFIILFHVADFWALLSSDVYDWSYNDSKVKIFRYIVKYRVHHKYSLNLNEIKLKKNLLNDVYVTQNDNSVLGKFYRPIENVNANKSILIFGCSFAYGEGLYNNETFSYNLGKLLPEYRIYNRAKGAWTTSHMLYQLENKDFSYLPNVKYVIYLFIPSHLFRNTNSKQSKLTPYYISKNGKLVLLKKSYKYLNFPILNYLKEHIAQKLSEDVYKTNAVKITKMMIEQAQKDVVNKFGKDTKFIVFRYDKSSEEPYNQMFEDLKQKGIIVISMEDISVCDYLSDKYIGPDGHPNAKAWKDITPLFVQYLYDSGIEH